MISKNLKKRIITSIALLFSIFLIFKYNYVLIYSLLVLGVLSFLEFINLSKEIINKKKYFFLINVIFGIYIFIFCYIFLIFSNIFQFKIMLFILLLACVASDIGGFVVGKIFKGPKLSKISPKKTIAGAFGSIIFTCITLSCLIFYFTNHFTFKILAMGIVTSIACQTGDLFFSFLKRKAKLKDTGNFLPGHGGVLDRLDSVFLGLPVGLITLTLIY